jgi:hypothetical protein
MSEANAGNTIREKRSRNFQTGDDAGKDFVCTVHGCPICQESQIWHG